MAPRRDAAGPSRPAEVDQRATEFQLGRPDCAFSSVVTGGWQGALDVAEDQADGCPTLPAGSVVTVRRIADERGHWGASRSD